MEKILGTEILDRKRNTVRALKKKLMDSCLIANMWLSNLGTHKEYEESVKKKYAKE